MRFSSLFLALPAAAALLLTACGGGQTADSSAPAEITDCKPSFPKEALVDQRQSGDTLQVVKSIYVEDVQDHEKCWTALHQVASQEAQGAKVAKVFFFDCPGHFPALKVDSTAMDAEYQAHCIASYERLADGTEKFTPRPFAGGPAR